MITLGIETSCDETSAALVEDDTGILSNVVSSQVELHAAFGGVVPELAARAHLERLPLVLEEALRQAGKDLSDVDLVAVTRGPGLIGALLVGVGFARGLALDRGLPLVGVSHLDGHIHSALLHSGDARLPLLTLVVSGGHTELVLLREDGTHEVLGRTLDDAAGEAFDKGARMLGLGYPGGPALERLAAKGDPEAFEFPVSGSRSRGGRGATRAFGRSLDFSFAGLKTSLLYRLRELEGRPAGGGAREADGPGGPARGGRWREWAPDLAASYQAAIVEHLVRRAEQALELTGLDRLTVGGGVAANGELRRRIGKLGATVHVPPRTLCTDNAAMIGAAARFARALPYPEYLGLDAYATGEHPR